MTRLEPDLAVPARTDETTAGDPRADRRASTDRRTATDVAVQAAPARRPRTRRPSRRRDEQVVAERTITSPLARRRPGARLGYWIFLCVLITVLTAIAVGPLYWMITGSLKATPELVRSPPTLFPEHVQWSNLIYALTTLQLGRYLTNTAILAIGTLIFQLLVGVPAAFALSVLKPPGARIWFGLIIATLFVPATVLFIPTYATIVHLPLLGVNLVGTWWAVWLPEAASAFQIFLLKRFFDRIPRELIDAARVDGATSLGLLRHVVLPVSRSIVAVLSIFSLTTSWNAFLWPKVALPNNDRWPLSVALDTFQETIELKYLLAALVISSIPPIVMFLIFQRRIISGLADTGLSG